LPVAISWGTTLLTVSIPIAKPTPVQQACPSQHYGKTWHFTAEPRAGVNGAGVLQRDGAVEGRHVLLSKVKALAGGSEL
jgi:hypothetical protein